MKTLLYIILFLVSTFLVQGQTTPIQTIGVAGGRVEARGQFKIDSLGFMGKYFGFPFLSSNSDTLGAFFFNLADSKMYVRDTISAGGHKWSSVTGIAQLFSKNAPISILGTDSVRMDTLVYGKIFNVMSFGAKGDGVTDDTHSIILADSAAWLAGGGIVWFPLGRYVINGPLIHSMDGIDPNCQICLPLTKDTATARYPMIVWEGAVPGNYSSEIIPGTPKNKDGVILLSTILDTGFVVGASNYFTPLTDSTNYTWFNMVNIEIRVRTTTSGVQVTPTMSGCDFRNLRSVSFDKVRIGPESSEGDILQPAQRTVGVYLPHVQNNGNIIINNLNVSGFNIGVVGAEHMTGTDLATFVCLIGLELPFMQHSGSITQFTSEGCKYHIHASANESMDLYIGNYNAEHDTASTWHKFSEDVFFDPGANAQVNIGNAHTVMTSVGKIWDFHTNDTTQVSLFGTQIGTGLFHKIQMNHSYFDNYTSGGVLDAIEVVNNAGGATFGIRNLDAVGFAGIEFLDFATGDVSALIGLNNSNNEIRFNNIAAGATFNFKINSTPALVINNNRSLSAPLYGSNTVTGTPSSCPAFDASGNIIELACSSSGSFSAVGAATSTFTVTIGVSESNTAYKVNVTPTASLSAVNFFVTNKTLTTFDVVYLSPLTGTVTFDWTLAP